MLLEIEGDGLDARNIFEPCPGNIPVSKGAPSDSVLNDTRREAVGDLDGIWCMKPLEGLGINGVIVTLEGEFSMGT